MPGPHARGDYGEAYINANWPVGTNLLDYEQATEMVRHIIAPAEGVCVNHPDRPVRENLDGDNLCQECCGAWARAEGNWAAYEASIEEGERG